MADYSRERNLRSIATLTDEEIERGDKYDLSAVNLAELRDELRRAGPMQRAILQREFDRLSSQAGAGGDVPAPRDAESLAAAGPRNGAARPDDMSAFLAQRRGQARAAAPSDLSMDEFLRHRAAVRQSIEPAPEPAGLVGRAKDIGISTLKGAIAIPEAAVGLADIATGGAVGKFLENEGGAIGFRPREAKGELSRYYTPEQQAAFREVEQADGFMGKMGAALANPSVVAQTVAESAPSMLAGGVVARGAVKLLPSMSRVVAGGVGEGVVGAGSAAEQIRQETPDGRLTPAQAGIAGSTGAVTGLLGVIAGKAAKTMGIGDVDTILAGGAGGAAQKGLVRKVIEGAVTEGVLEELPQSVQEQVQQNYALGKPLDAGVDHAAVLGLLSGAAMGGPAALLSGSGVAPAQQPAPPVHVPVVGPMSAAANVAVATGAQPPDTSEKTPAGAPVEQGVQAATKPIVEEPSAAAPAEPAEAVAPPAPAGDLAPAAAGPAAPDVPAPGPAPVQAARVDPSTGEVLPTIAPAGVSPPSQAAAAQRFADEPPGEEAFGDVKEGDILTTIGKSPFRNMMAAQTALARAGAGHQLVRVKGGLVVRPDAPKAAEAPAPKPTTAALPAATAPAQPTTLGSSVQAQPAGTRGTTAADVIHAAAHEAATSPQNDRPEPTQAQKEAGNYKLGHARWNGLDLSFENPKGSERKGIDPNGKPWSVTMPAHYGYVRRTEGADGDHVDIYMGDNTESQQVFVIDQKHANGPDAGKFDEHKVFLGVDSIEEATRLYDAGFSDGKGPERRSAVTPMSVDEFKAWIKSGDTTKPVGVAEPAAAPIAEPAAPSPAVDPDEAAWDRATADERQAKLLAAGWTARNGVPSAATQRMMGLPWSKVTPPQRARILAGKATEPKQTQAAAPPVQDAGAEAPAPAVIAKRKTALEKRAQAIEARQSRAAAAPAPPPPAEPGVPAAAVARLRASGEKLAEDGEAERSRDRNTNTARRVSMAANAEAAAAKKVSIGKTMVRLADALAAGEVRALAGVRNRAQIEMIDGIRTHAMYARERAENRSYVEQQRMRGRAFEPADLNHVEYPQAASWIDGGREALQAAVKGKKGASELNNLLRRPGSRVSSEILAAAQKVLTDDQIRSAVGWYALEAMTKLKRMQSTGITSLEQLREAVREYNDLLVDKPKADPIKEAERALVGRKVGVDFFPTPKAVAERMAGMAGIQSGMRVLEPSAGNGHLADAARAAGGTVDVVEVSDALRDILTAKGYDIVGRDFEEFEPTEKYDAVLMNPPFSDRKDAAHIQRAFDMLKPGGRLVAIAGEGVFIGSDAKAKAFRAWLDGQGAEVESLPAGTFKGADLPAQTGANARLLTIERPEAVAVTDTPAAPATASEPEPAPSDAQGAMFSRSQPADDAAERNALTALSENDDLFQVPRSSATSLEEIAAEIAPGMKVRESSRSGLRTDYNLTLPDGNTARLVVREPNPYGPAVYGFTTVEGENTDLQMGRPGENAQAADGKGDVWIDVSLLKPGGGGTRIYAIAANFAHNTGRVFIGDPAGLSDEAMFRRPEQMLSSALKFGTTEHLAPHPRQLQGDASLGIPPLRWVYGDDLGNIRRLIDVNLAATEDSAAASITFDPANGQFLDTEGQPLTQDSIRVLAQAPAFSGAAGAGTATVARTAVLRALVREEGRAAQGGDGRRDGLLARLVLLGNQPRAATRGIFYSRAVERAGGARVTEVQELIDQISKRWENAPTIVVVRNMQDPLVPQAARDADQQQRSQGATGDPEGLFHDGKVYLFAEQLGGAADVVRVLFHESLGHYGLRGTFGKELTGILDRMSILQAGKVRAKARQYGLDFEKQADRRAAAEEVLAELAQTSPELGWVQKAIAAIRTWLREHVPGFSAMKLTDNEVIAQFILPARRFVQRGNAPAASGEPMATAFQRVWHGTPHRDIEQFSTDAVGTGEGAQAYGWGLYFASKRDIAEHYRKGLSQRALIDRAREAYDEFESPSDAADALLRDEQLSDAQRELVSALSADDWLGFDYPHQAIREAMRPGGADRFDMSDRTLAAIDKQGQLYQVEIPEDTEMLLWDRPLSEQPATVRRALEGSAAPNRSGQNILELDPSGQALYAAVSRQQGSDEAASRWLSKIGVRGIKYLDGSSRAAGDGSHNYVVFDGADTEITATAFSRSLGTALTDSMNSVRDVRLPAGYVVGDLLNDSGKLSWWHRTVGTMHNLAARHPSFGRVYDAAQSFLNDVSLYATEAADLAPRILPKLETWKDIAKSPLSPEDTKAISAPIFEGTLTWARDRDGKAVKHADLVARGEEMDSAEKARELFRAGKLDEKTMRMWQGMPLDQFDVFVETRYQREMLKAGVVWKDAELRALFNLTDQQISLYREFRAATDRSLSDLARSDMIRFAGEDAAEVRERALAAETLDEAAVILRDHLFKSAETDQERAKVLNDTANRLIEKADRAKELMALGYAPLSRFGQFTLDVVDASGERVYFGLFDSQMERSRMARRMATEFPGAEVRQGTVSQEAHKLFAGVSPETLELFGEMLGLERTGDAAKDVAFQQFLKLTKSTRSAMKRLIERKGISGFSEDAGRVLAGFVYSNARQTSSNLHMGELTHAANDIPQQAGQLKDEAIRLVEYVKNPQEEAQKIRGLLFAQYLGGSIASAMVNATQPFAVTFPYLSQWGGVSKAAKRMAGAVRAANTKGTGDKSLDAALKHAEEQGIVAPQEVHQLMAQAQGHSALKAGDGTRAGNAAATASNALAKLALAWGKVFGIAEQFNRRVTFIAAYRTATEEGIPNPDLFAAKAVADTQFVYNKGSKPRWARGAIGSTLFTFKQYSVNYLELLSRMWNVGEEGSPERAAGRKAVLLGLAVLFLMGGADGLPFEQDAEDVVDATMQRLGYSFSSAQAKREFFASVLGEAGGRFVEKGLSGLPGAPIDVSGRMGLGNLIPGTGLLTKRADHTSDVLELAGPVADLAKRAGQAGGKLLAGEVASAANTIAPTAARNLTQAVEMAATGEYRDFRGRKVLDVDAFDALAKGIGFQPNDVARVQEATREVQDLVAQVKLRKSEIAEAWAKGLANRDQDQVQEAKDMLARWNELNPESRIRVDMSAILRRVRSMREDKATRIAKSAPKEIRAAVQDRLSAEAN